MLTNGFEYQGITSSFLVLEVSNSGRFGLWVSGDNSTIEECSVHDCVRSGILIGDGTGNAPTITSGLVQYNLTYRNRNQAPGIFLQRGKSASAAFLDGVTIRRNLCFRNGFDESNMQTDATSNTGCDGIQIFKDMHETYDPNFTAVRNGTSDGRWNLSRNIKVHENIAWHNSDDGICESAGQGLVMNGNISANNGPGGVRGFKTYTGDKGGFEVTKYLGNVAFNQADGGAGTQYGFEIQCYDNANGLFPIPPKPTRYRTNNSAFHHGTGFGFRNPRGTGGTKYNELSLAAAHTGSDAYPVGTWTEANNLYDPGTAPTFINVSYNTISDTLPGSYGTDSVRTIFWKKWVEVASNHMPLRTDTIAYNKGTLNTTIFHSTNPADDPINPADPNDVEKLRWYAD